MRIDAVRAVRQADRLVLCCDADAIGPTVVLLDPDGRRLVLVPSSPTA